MWCGADFLLVSETFTAAAPPVVSTSPNSSFTCLMAASTSSAPLIIGAAKFNYNHGKQ